jgi:hypothetical protein
MFVITIRGIDQSFGFLAQRTELSLQSFQLRQDFVHNAVDDIVAGTRSDFSRAGRTWLDKIKPRKHLLQLSLRRIGSRGLLGRKGLT